MTDRVCTAPGCDRPVRAKGLCVAHWSQFHRRGFLPQRTRLHANEIRQHGEWAELVLCDTLAREVAASQIDSADIALVSKYKWYLTRGGYVMARVDQSHQVFLHRLLFNVESREQEVDHIDGDPLNNRRSNLRVCNRQQNAMNLKVRSDNSSGITGVSFDRRRWLWRARIHVRGKDKHLGYFFEKKDAIRARRDAEKKYFREFARATNN